jgi:RimJ/RimL family protein N-acetyltransferase
MSVQNLASQQVAIKIGAGFEHIAKGALELHGISHDAFVYSLNTKHIDTAV